MTPKQKAIELVDKYQYVENKYKEYLTYEQCKQCALIAVDEMIKTAEIFDYCETIVKNYNEVKTEIENYKSEGNRINA